MGTLRIALTRLWFPRGLTLSLLLSTLSVVLLPAWAHATNYLWGTNGNGDWNDARNWACVPDTGPWRSFPTGPGDLAAFAGTFTRTVNVFLTTNIMVGAIYVNDTKRQLLGTSLRRNVSVSGDAPGLRRQYRAMRHGIAGTYGSSGSLDPASY
jgi:hypothetical protein